MMPLGVDIDDLIYEITSRFDASITPAEARALAASPEKEKDLKWLIDCLSEVAIDHENIESFNSIDFERFRGVGLAIADQNVFIFSFDELRQRVTFKQIDGPERGDWEDLVAATKISDAQSHAVIIRFYDRETEAMAIVPGVESHWFFAPLWKNRRFLLQAGFASLLTNIFAVGTSLFAMIVYNRIIPANAMSSLYVLVTGMVVLLVADYAMKTIRARLLGMSGIEADIVIADRLFGQIIDLQYRSKKDSVGTLASTLKEYEQIREFFTSATLVSLIDMPFALIFVAFIWIIGGYMVLPVLIGIGILFAVTLYVQPRLKRVAEQSLEDAHNKHSVLVETLSGLETVKLLGAGGLLRRRFKSVVAKQAEMAEESKRHTFFSQNLAQEVQQGVQIAVVTVGAITVTTGAYGYGAIIACTILSGKALLPFAQVAQLLSRLNQIVIGYKSLNTLMSQPVEHAKGESFLKRGRYQGSLEFKDVGFSYPDQQGKALDNVSFKIEAGERVAIVGRVGSGKTTIGKLASKLFITDAGKVLIDGIDILQLDPAEVRENIGMVVQEPWLIAGTIEQNILLGANEATTEDLLWASRLSGVAEFVDRHPSGYKLKLGERGEGISGGQKQSITIARALVKRPSILLFDEPTSAMDSRTEKSFIDHFKNAKLDATLVLITHRTSLLALVDRVLVVDQGKIVASGSVEGFLKAASGGLAGVVAGAVNSSSSKASGPSTAVAAAG